MDPITTAIFAAIAAGAPAATTHVLSDAYTGLKALIQRKFGSNHDVVKAVEGLEARPESAGRKETLKEEVTAAKLDQDPEIRAAAQALLEQIKAQPGGAQHVQQAIGNYNAVADRGSTASVNVNHPKE